MEPRSEAASSVWPFAFAPEDWTHTPTAVQAYVYTLQDELTQLRACGRLGGSPQTELHDLIQATIIGFTL